MDVVESRRRGPVLGRLRGWLGATAIVLGGTTLLATLTEPLSDAPVRALLRQSWAPTVGELTALGRGTGIVKTLSPQSPEDLPFIGAIQLDVPADRFVERFRDIERFDAGKDDARGFRRIHKFRSPATLEDLKHLELGEKDIRSLRACTPGDCDLKLPAAAITRFQKEINWNAGDATARANQLTREIMLGRLTAYQRDGDRALAPSNDRATPLDTVQAFHGMLAYAAPLSAYVPELAAYIRAFPRTSLANAEEFFYWTDVEFGLKPTLRLSHVIIYRVPPNPAGISYAILTKQLYASHYLHSTLELRFLVDDGRGPSGQGCYLVCWFDARSDGFTGVFGPIIRLQARRKFRANLLDYLHHVKERLELPANGA